MEFFLLFFFLSLLFLLCLIFSSLEKAIVATNQFLFKQTYTPSKLLVRWSHQIMDSSSESLKVCWFGKTFFLLLLSSLIATHLPFSDVHFFLVLVAILISVEIIPKVFSEIFSESIIIYCSPVLLSFKPLLVLFVTIANSIGEGFSFVLRSDKNLNTFFIKQDLREIILQSKREGKTLEKDLEIISNLFEVRAVTAKEIMIPRKDILALPKRSTIEDVRETFKQAQHSRLIVYEDTIDNIVGCIELDDVFKQPRRMSDILKDVFFIPESRKLFDIFQDFFRYKDTLISVVVDEYGGTAGIISLADLTEEIIGDIKTESGERRKKKPQPAPCVMVAANAYKVSGKLKTETLKEISSFDITGIGYETVSGFVLQFLQRIPISGEHFSYKEYHITILSASKTQIESIIIKK